MHGVERLMSEDDFFDVKDGVNIEPVDVYYVWKEEKKNKTASLDELREQVASELHIPIEQMSVCTVKCSHAIEHTGKKAIKVKLDGVPDFDYKDYLIM